MVLFEAHRVGWGASGRSGAQVIAGVSCGQEKLEKLIGAADARRVWDTTVEGIDLMRELIARYAIECDWVNGSTTVAINHARNWPCARAHDAARQIRLHGPALAADR